MKPAIAFLGLGVMGFPMAGHLAQQGYAVRVFNRTAAKADKWVKTYGAAAADTPKAAVHNADIVITCVGNDDDVRQIYTAELGIFAGLKMGAICVDHTTASADIAEHLAEQAQQQQAVFLDAPVSGGQAGAENGQLTIMVGGDRSAYAKVEAVLNVYAKAVNHLGPVGSGQRCKMVNQICIAGLLQGLAEGLHFAKATGLDVMQVVDVISQGAAQSWQMVNRSETMLQGEYNYGFAVDWMRKDLAIALQEAKRNGALLPVTALVDQFYGEVQKLGGGRWDTSSLLARLDAFTSQ